MFQVEACQNLVEAQLVDQALGKQSKAAGGKAPLWLRQKLVKMCKDVQNVFPEAVTYVSFSLGGPFFAGRMHGAFKKYC